MRALTPSETVYLHAEDFAREKKLLDAVAVLHTEKKFDASELAEAVLAAALVAAEDAGAVTLAQGKASRLFGLRKVDVVEVAKGPKEPAFPAGTIEARVAALVAERPLETQRLIYQLLGDDSTYPELLALSAVQRGLLDAKLLESETTTRLKVFRTETLRLPEATRELAQRTPAAPVRERLAAWRAARPQEWLLLTKGIAAGIASRKEASDGPD